jgi:O-antigen ligase
MSALALAARSNRLALVAACLGAGAGTAAACLLVSGSPARVFLALGAVVLGVLVVRNPAVGALAFIVVVAAVPHDVYSKGLPLSSGELQATDLLLLLTLGSWVLTLLAPGCRMGAQSGSVAFVVGGFVLVSGLSLYTAHTLGFDLKLGLTELRPLLSLLLVFPIVASVRSLRDLELGIGVVLVASAAGSALTIARYVEGDTSVASFTDGADRVLDAPFLYAVVAIVWAAVLAVRYRPGRMRVLLGLLAAVSLTSLLVTFQRGAWLALLAGLPCVVLFLPRVRRRRLVAAIVAFAGLVAVALVSAWALSVGPADRLLTAGGERLVSISDYREDVSSGHRFAEWTRALEVVETRPLTGIGLGGTITFYSPMWNPEQQTMGGPWTTFYIHNSYIWVALKTGLVGFAFFLGILAVAARSGWRGYRRAVGDRARLLLLGALSTLVVLAVLALTGPHLTSDQATPYLGALLALIVLVPRLERADSDRGGPPARVGG